MTKKLYIGDTSFHKGITKAFADHLFSHKKKGKQLKVHSKDDRMMEDGTLNLNHSSIKDPWTSESKYNEQLRASDGGM